MGELLLQPGVGVGQSGLVLDDVQGHCDGLRGVLLQHIVEACVLTGNVAGNENRFHLKKTFSGAYGPEGGDFDDSIYRNLLCSRLLCICREKFCAEVRIRLGKVFITVLHARQATVHTKTIY